MKNYYSTMTSKGQVTIPTMVRNKMNLSSGIKLEFIVQNEHILLIPINKSINDSKGILPRPKRVLSNEEIDKVVRDSYSGRYDRP